MTPTLVDFVVGALSSFLSLLLSTGASGPVQSWNVVAVLLGFFQVDDLVVLSSFRRNSGGSKWITVTQNSCLVYIGQDLTLWFSNI